MKALTGLGKMIGSRAVTRAASSRPIHTRINPDDTMESREHTAQEAQEMNVSKDFANKHYNETENNSGKEVNLAALSQQQRDMRTQLGLRNPENNSSVSFAKGNPPVIHRDGRVGTLSAKDVLGITTHSRTTGTSRSNTSVTVTSRSPFAVFNHLSKANNDDDN